MKTKQITNKICSNREKRLTIVMQEMGGGLEPACRKESKSIGSKYQSNKL